MTAKTLYAYTLQPVPYEVSEQEQRQAQLMIWRGTNKVQPQSLVDHDCTCGAFTDCSRPDQVLLQPIQPQFAGW